ncbi:MAG TPA: hypothetical protein VNF68_14750 [Candidatus Baltobacteraceae bacterium]|nr:hypothetical protein [Candidatus Baltobacteraceae bacterium]
MKLSTLFAVSAIAALAACGGGGGGTTGGGTMPPTPTATATPTPSATLSGKVVQLAGPLAANGAPTASSTPAAGAGIGGATLYVTNATTAALVAPQSSPLATVTTAPDGSFSVTFANPTKVTTFGVVAMNGTTVGTNGTTNLGYTIAHALVVPGSPSTLYLDTLTTNEQAGFTAYNAARTALSMPTVASDTALEMTARLEIVNNENGLCKSSSNISTEYQAFGGATLPGVAVAGDEPMTPFYNTWPSQISFPAQTGLDFAGFAGPVSGPVCAGSTLPQNYFAELLVIG